MCFSKLEGFPRFVKTATSEDHRLHTREARTFQNHIEVV